MEMKFQEQVERLTEEDDNTVNEGVPNQQTPSEESREREIVSGEKGELKVKNNIFVSAFNDVRFFQFFFNVKVQQMPCELDLIKIWVTRLTQRKA